MGGPDRVPQSVRSHEINNTKSPSHISDSDNNEAAFTDGPFHQKYQHVSISHMHLIHASKLMGSSGGP